MLSARTVLLRELGMPRVKPGKDRWFHLARKD